MWGKKLSKCIAKKNKKDTLKKQVDTYFAPAVNVTNSWTSLSIIHGVYVGPEEAVTSMSFKGFQTLTLKVENS